MDPSILMPVLTSADSGSVSSLGPAWITAAVALATAVICLFAWTIRWAWRILNGTQEFLVDWKGEPERPGVPARPGVMARLQTVEFIVTDVRGEMFPNGGGTLRDVVHRTAEDVAEARRDLAAMRGRLELFEHQREVRDDEANS